MPVLVGSRSLPLLALRTPILRLIQNLRKFAVRVILFKNLASQRLVRRIPSISAGKSVVEEGTDIEALSAATLLKRLDSVGKPRDAILHRLAILHREGNLGQHLVDVAASDLGRELADHDLAKNGLGAV